MATSSLLRTHERRQADQLKRNPPFVVNGGLRRFAAEPYNFLQYPAKTFARVELADCSPASSGFAPRLYVSAIRVARRY